MRRVLYNRRNAERPRPLLGSTFFPTVLGDVIAYTPGSGSRHYLTQPECHGVGPNPDSWGKCILAVARRQTDADPTVWQSVSRHEALTGVFSPRSHGCRARVRTWQDWAHWCSTRSSIICRAELRSHCFPSSFHCIGWLQPAQASAI